MAPKHESYITDERKQEIRDLLEEKGFETDRFSVKEAEWLDRALKANWKVPTTSAAEAMKNAEPKKTQKKALRTYVVHSARSFLGEPVGQKHEA